MAIHQYLDVEVPATPTTRGVQAALYRAGGTHYLVALNNDDHDKLAQVRVDLGRRSEDAYTVRHVIGSGRRGETRGTSRQDPRHLTVNLAAKGGAILEIRPVHASQHAFAVELHHRLVEVGSVVARARQAPALRCPNGVT